MKRKMLAVLASLATTVPLTASGVELGWGQVVVPSCCVVPADPVIIHPYTPPHVGFALPPPQRVVVWPSPTRVLVDVPSVDVSVRDDAPEPTDTMDDRGAGLRAARRVVVGGGYGGLLVGNNGEFSLGSSYRLHLGLALRQLSVGLRFDIAPAALKLAPDTRGSRAGSYYIGGLGFGYHFNPDGLLHPVMGASVELHTLDPERGEAAVGFGVGARAGLEMEYPLDFGSLGVGVDATAHRRLVSDDSFEERAASALAFGGYLDYRF